MTGDYHEGPQYDLSRPFLFFSVSFLNTKLYNYITQVLAMFDFHYYT